MEVLPQVESYVAEALEIAADEPVLKVARIMKVDGEPWMVNTSCVCARLLPGVRAPGDLRHGSLWRTLEANGVSLARTNTSVRARLARPEELAWLEVEAPQAVTVLHHRNFDAEGRPVEYTSSVCKGTVAIEFDSAFRQVNEAKPDT